MKKIDRTGEVSINSQGYSMKIVRYKNCRDIDVEFENGAIATHVQYITFKKKTITNPLHPTVCGVGYLGNFEDKAYVTATKASKSYASWIGMLKRCYAKESLSKHSSYVGCEVCDEWKCYANFEKWFKANYYEIPNETMCLDKDILIKGNKIYSPQTAIFCPQRINTLFIRNWSVRGDMPIGVYKYESNKHQSKPYIAQCNIKERQINLGYFKTMEEAFNAYKEAKENEIRRVADEFKDRIPQKLYDAMYNYQVEITD